MGSFLVVVFWIWCGVSIVILTTRPIYRRMKNPPPPLPEMLPAEPDIPATVPSDDASTREVEVPEAPDLPPEDRRTDVEIPAGPSPTSPVISTRRRSVAEVLSGIQMPCDLAPLMGADGAIDPTHVVFATEGHPPLEVGSSVGDELERIGCRLESLDATTLRADRGADSVEVRIHPDAASAMDGAVPRFPTARAGAVVVEFRVR